MLYEYGELMAVGYVAVKVWKEYAPNSVGKNIVEIHITRTTR